MRITLLHGCLGLMVAGFGSTIAGADIHAIPGGSGLCGADWERFQTSIVPGWSPLFGPPSWAKISVRPSGVNAKAETGLESPLMTATALDGNEARNRGEIEL
jgi:hypothetical protein